MNVPRETQTFYLTFGMQYPSREIHPKFPEANRDGWVEIEADNYAEARSLAFQWLGVKWSEIYTADNWRPEYCPLGCLARAKFDARTQGDIFPAVVVEVLAHG